jgi:hypothetical protein
MLSCSFQTFYFKSFLDFLKIVKYTIHKFEWYFQTLYLKNFTKNEELYYLLVFYNLRLFDIILLNLLLFLNINFVFLKTVKHIIKKLE